eukprot:TRINITY_DN437_c0_g3_i1.p1 TRINITY_DN437_c0_g3~~TRINITY_DN437_c0_g3_i1.p1  ORF type:complete len:516 (-),score=124.91 TRINITY_DN437_c0_g3_i1:72-1619(-)
MKAVVVAIIGIVALASFASAENLCPDGKWLKSDKTCQDCPKDCNLCNAINDQANCLQCQNDKILDLSGAVGTCVDCAANCKSCTGPKPEDCVKANPDFGPKVGTKELIACPRNCQYCSADNKCARCHYGFFLEKEACIACPINCGECKKEKETDTAATCVKCNSEYALAADKTCKKCESGCFECTETACTKTMLTHFLSSGKVTKGPDDCAIVDDKGACKKCADEFGIKEGKCQKCSEINANCASCKEGKCTACKETSTSLKAVSFVNGNCVECPENCVKCGENGVCTECNKKSLLDNGKCVVGAVGGCEEVGKTADTCAKCGPNFRLIEDGKKCSFIRCPSGQGWDDKATCVECPMTNCKKCDARDKRCIETVSGYYADGADVKPCPKGCAKCEKKNNKLVCTQVANENARTSGILNIQPKTAEGGYFCDASCGSCYGIQDSHQCGSCRPGHVISYAPLDNGDLAMFCIDSNLNCPKPTKTDTQEFCAGLTPPKKYSMILGISVFASFIVALFA